MLTQPNLTVKLLADKTLAPDLNAKDILRGMSLEQGPFRLVPLQQVGGQRHLPTGDVGPQSLTHPSAKKGQQSCLAHVVTALHTELAAPSSETVQKAGRELVSL